MGHLRRSSGVSGDPPSADARLAALAARQDGVFTVVQARRLGFERDALAWRIDRRWMHRVHRGVYALGLPPLTDAGRLRAGTYACGETAALSHLAAGWLRGAVRSAPTRVDVTTTRRRRGPDGVRLHRTRAFHADDVVTVDGFRVTSWARTLVDLAEVLSTDRLAKVLHESEYRQVFDLRALEAAIERANGRRGVKHLVAALGAHRPRGETESDLEDMFLDFLDRRDLQLPVTQQWIRACGASFRVDAFFPQQRLCVELDGRRAHGTSQRFVADRRRDADLLVAGYVPLRLTGPDLTTEARRTEERLRQLGVRDR